MAVGDMYSKGLGEVEPLLDPAEPGSDLLIKIEPVPYVEALNWVLAAPSEPPR